MKPFGWPLAVKFHQVAVSIALANSGFGVRRRELETFLLTRLRLRAYHEHRVPDIANFTEFCRRFREGSPLSG